MKKWVKPFGIAVGVLLACLAVAGVCLLGYARTDHFRTSLLKAINASIAGRLSLEGHDISFLAGRVDLIKPALKGPRGRELASLDHLTVDVAYLPLLKRIVVIESLVLTDPHLRLSLSRDGRADIVEAFQPTAAKPESSAPKEPGRPFQVVVSQASIRNGRFDFIDPGRHLEVGLNRIAVEAQADLFHQTGKIRLEVDRSALALGAHRLKIQPLSLSLVREKDRPVSMVLEAATDFAHVKLSGTAQPAWLDPKLNLKLGFDCSLAELNRLLQLPMEITGQTAGELTLAGDWRDPAADIRLSYHGGSLAGYRVDKLQAQATLKNRLVTLGQLDIRAGTGAIGISGRAGLEEVFPEGFASARMDLDGLAYDLKAGLKQVDLAWLAKGVDGLSGTLDADLSLTGNGVAVKKRRASGRVDLDLKRLLMKGMRRATDLRIHASVGAEAAVVDLAQLTVTAPETRMDGQGTFDTASEEMRAQLKAEVGNLESLLSLFGVDGGAGAGGVTVDLAGPWRRPEVGVAVRGRQIRFQQARLGELELSASLDRSGLVKVARLGLFNQGTDIQAWGTIQLFADGWRLHGTMPLEAELRVTDGDVRDFVEGLDLSGAFEGRVQLGGSLGALEALAALRGKSVAYGSILLGDIAADARFLNGELLLKALRLERPGATITMSGAVRAFQPNSWARLTDPVLSLDAAGDIASIADIVPEVQGRLTLDAHLNGALSDLKGRARMEARDLNVYGQEAQRLSLAMELRENRLHATAVEAAIDAESMVTGSGWIALDRRFSFELSSKDLWLNSIRKIRETESIQGRMDLRVQGEGTFDDPGITGDVQVKEVRIRQEKMDDFDFRIDFSHGRLSVKGRQTFDLDLAYHLEERDFNVDIVFADTNLAPFFLTAGIKDFGGTLSGKVAARGNAAALKKSEALVDISRLSLTFGEEPFAGADAIQARLESQRLWVPEFRLNFLKSGVLRVKASGDLDGHVDLSARGDIPANTARLFLQDIDDIQGNIHLQAEMKGALSDPGWSGEIVFQDVGFVLPQVVAAFKGINGKVVLNPSRIAIENIQGKMDAGTFGLTGEAALEKFRPGKISLKLSGNRLPVVIPEAMDVLLAADLTAAGTMDRMRIEGDVVILEGLYYKDFKLNLLQKMTEKKRPAAPSAGETGKSFLDRIAVDVKLKYRQPFTVDNNIAYLEIQPDLALSGTLQSPVVSGMAKVEEGSISYQNKSFVVEKGIIGFVNPYKIEAEIDIVGSIKVRQWRISLSLSGTPDRLMMELSSIPPEDDADILSLLVFGKTTNEMSGGGNGALDSTEALMARLMASSFGEDIKKATGLDYLEVETENGQLEDESDTVKVTVGKDLTERLAVKYTIGSGAEGYDQRAATEYKLLEHIMLGGFQDIKGSYGGEIIFRFEFR